MRRANAGSRRAKRCSAIAMSSERSCPRTHPPVCCGRGLLRCNAARSITQWTIQSRCLATAADGRKLMACPIPPARPVSLRTNPRRLRRRSSAPRTAYRKERSRRRSSSAWIALHRWTLKLLWLGCAAKDPIPGPKNHARRRAPPFLGPFRSHARPRRHGGRGSHDCDAGERATTGSFGRVNSRDRVATPRASLGSESRRPAALAILPIRRRESDGARRQCSSAGPAVAATAAAHDEGFAPGRFVVTARNASVLSGGFQT